jgi:hypothetical protein
VVAAFIEAYARDAKSRAWPLCIGAIAAALAVLIRPTTVIVLSIPALFALQSVLTAWPRFRRRSLQLARPLLWVVMPTLAAWLAWSAYNWKQYRYFGASNFTQTVRFTGRMDTGTFDVRALAFDERLRHAYLAGRAGAGYWEYHVHFVAPFTVVKYRSRYVSEINAGLADVIARSDRINPWQLTAVRLLRGIWWGAALPPTVNYNGYLFEFRPLKWDMDTAAFEHAFPGVRLDSPAPSATFAAYTDWGSAIYNALRPIVYALAMLAALLGLYLRSWLLAPPMIVHTANVLVHALLGVVYARYIQLFDTLLFAQVAIAWGLLRNAKLNSNRSLIVARPSTP